MRRRLFVVTVLLGMVAALAPGALARAASSGWDPEKVWNASTDDWEPAIAAAPGSSWVYEETTRYHYAKACQQCPSPAIIFRASSDGGVTWGADKYICVCKNVKAQNDPQLEIATDGTVYSVWMNDYNPGVVFSKSSDHGQTWTTPIPLKGSSGFSFTDKPILTISPSGRDVYVAYNKSDSYVAASHNYGASFSQPVKTNSDSRYWFAEGGQVAPNGNVFFSESAENQNETGTVQLWVLRSTNGGASWTSTLVDTSQQQPACAVASCPGDFFGSQAALSVDEAGTLMVVYSANSTAGANKQLYVRTSTDGVTWSARTEIGLNSGDSGFPVVASGPTAGDFRVAWQDNRNGASAYNTWFRRTTNGGGTWGATIRLSNATSGAPYQTSAGYAFPYGDYFDLSVDSSGRNYVIWSEGLSYVGPGGTWFTKGS